MSSSANLSSARIDQFFAGPGARGDQWRDLVELATAWCKGSGTRADFDAAFASMTATESFHAYPGHHLISMLHDHAAANDARATASLARRITRSLLTRSFRQSAGDWDSDDDGQGVAADPEAARHADHIRGPGA